MNPTQTRYAHPPGTEGVAGGLYTALHHKLVATAVGNQRVVGCVISDMEFQTLEKENKEPLGALTLPQTY